MDLMTIILSCSFHTLNDNLVESIALAESDGLPRYVRPFGAADGTEYRTDAHALRAINRLIDSRQGVYVGLMGIPIESATKYDAGPKQLLDPCVNLSVASSILSELKDNCTSDRVPEPITCALDRYAVMTEQEPSFTESILQGALTPSYEDGATLPSDKVAAGARVFWESNSTAEQHNNIFFDVAIGSTDDNSSVKTAKDLNDK